MLEAETIKMMDQVDELMNDAIKVSGLGLDDLASLDEEQFQLIQRYFKLWDTCKKLSLEQAKTMDKIDEMDKKLDKIIKLLEKK